jgi:hypothetical protein
MKTEAEYIAEFNNLKNQPFWSGMSNDQIRSIRDRCQSIFVFRQLTMTSQIKLEIDTGNQNTATAANCGALNALFLPLLDIAFRGQQIPDYHGQQAQNIIPELDRAVDSLRNGRRDYLALTSASTGSKTPGARFCAQVAGLLPRSSDLYYLYRSLENANLEFCVLIDRTVRGYGIIASLRTKAVLEISRAAFC